MNTMNATEYHSQNNEAEVVINYFGAFVGNVLDIGANDGITFSNSYDLIQRGWSAMLVEPCPEPFERLKVVHAKKPVVYANCAIGTVTEKKMMYVPDDTLIASADKQQVETWKHAAGNTKEVETVFLSWPDFCAHSPLFEGYDFISIDAEGSDWDILQQMNLTEMGCKCICIEHSGNFDNIKNYCAQFGLTKELLRNGENIILAK